MADNGNGSTAGDSIRSTAAAILFAVLYFPLLLAFIWRRFHHALEAYTVATLYCAARVTSFSMRAAITQSTAAANNDGLRIALAILSGVGFVGLLWASYEIVLDRERITGIPLSGLPASILLNRSLIWMTLTAASIVGIVGAVKSVTETDTEGLESAKDLRDASLYMFFAITILLAVQTALVVYRELTSPLPVGLRHVAPLLAVLTTCLMTRECFLTATSNRLDDQNKESLWYPLAALPELLAVSILAVPGLVPVDMPKDGSKEQDENEEQEMAVQPENLDSGVNSVNSSRGIHRESV